MDSGLATGFRPTYLSGCVLWLDFPSTPGNDGDPIAAASNRAPTGSVNDVTQPTAGNKPLLRRGVNGINGLGVLQFDGIDDFLLNPIDTRDACSDFVVFALGSVPGASTVESLVRYKSATGPVFSELLLANTGGYQPYSFEANYSSTTSASVGIADSLDTNPHILASLFGGSSPSTPASYTTSLDGTTKTVVASGNFAAVATDKGSIGARCSSANAASIPFNGKLGEVIRFNRQLSTYEQAIVTKYLRNKWGV